MAVVIPEGIAGQTTEVSAHYSKVLLIIDHNSAVDALVQRDRARGIIKGGSADQCIFKYVLRKHDVVVDDIVVSSGLDGVFPKGLSVGYVSGVVKPKSWGATAAGALDSAMGRVREKVLLAGPPDRRKQMGACVGHARQCAAWRRMRGAGCGAR